MRVFLSIFLCFCLISWLPAAAVEQINKIKMIVGDDDVDVIFQFRDEHLFVLSKKGKTEIKKIAFTDFETADYSFSKHRRWRSGIGAAVIGGIFALPLFFMKGKKHWLTIRTTAEETIGFRLDKNNFDQVIAEIEERCKPLRVERLGEE